MEIYHLIITYTYMLQLVIAITLITSSLCGEPKDMAGFWGTQLGHKIDFQAYTGYEEIDQYYKAGTTGMFYQLFGAYGVDIKNPSPDHPIFVWLQGGPGASSQFGAFTEVGPIKIKGGKVSENSWSWLTFGHLLFVDSPLNVGFSYSDQNRTGQMQVNSTNHATDHLVNFLDNFFKRWTNLTENKIYIVGQSFGGHYAPVLGRKLLDNTKYAHRVAGIIIGDGWTDPINQINYYDTYLWSVGVIDRSFRETCTWFQTQSMLNMDLQNFQNATNYFDFLTNNDTTAQKLMGNISMFNFRNYDGLDMSFADFIQKNKDQFGATVDFILQNEAVYTAFSNDMTKSVVADVVKCLRKTKVLIYNGQNDVVVNTPGVLHYLSSIDWQHIHQWKKTKKQIFKISNENAGWAKVHDNLWFVLVNGAGHMVPSDQPSRVFQLMLRFLNNWNEWDV